MKIYLGTNPSIHQERALTNIGYKHRLFSYFDLRETGQGEDYLKKYKETGLGRDMDDTLYKEIIERTDAYKKASTKMGEQDDLESIKEEIDRRVLFRKYSGYAKNYNAIRIGELLDIAKDKYLHGNYEKWVKDNWGKQISRARAALYKSMYKKLHLYKKIILYLPLNFLEYLTEKAKKIPHDTLGLIDNNAEYLKNADLNAIKADYDRYKEGKIDLPTLEQTIIDQSASGKDKFDKIMKRGKGDIVKTKENLRKIENLITYFERYDFKDAYVDEILHTRDQLISFSDLFKDWADRIETVGYTRRWIEAKNRPRSKYKVNFI